MSSRPLQLLTSIFTSLAHDTHRWTLLRTLKSDNPLDIQGDLHGTATFTRLPPASPTPTPALQNASAPPHPTTYDMIYHEEGDMPAKLGVGLRWTKNYMWRMSPTGRISVWFVKVGTDNEADYLFHDFDFGVAAGGDSTAASPSPEQSQDQEEGETFVTAPVPPAVSGRGASTTVVTAKGNHLCINDMYRTAYAFRVEEESGEVVSWASRHVVKGPKKNQDIVNLYSLLE